MKTFTLIVIVMGLWVLKGKAQIIGKIKPIKDTLKKEEDFLKGPKDTAYVSPAAFQKKVKTVFGQLATGQASTTVLANYADLDIADSKLGFNGSLGISPYIFGNISASGKIDNNVAQLFDNYKLNTSTSVDLKVSFLLWTRFYFGEKDYKALKSKRFYYNDKQQKADVKVGYDSLANIAYKGMFTNQLQGIHDSLDIIRNILNTPEREKLTDVTIHQLGEAFYRLQLDSINIKKKADSTDLVYKEPNKFENLRKAYKDSIDKEIETAELSAPFSSIHMVWLTPRITIGRKKFYLYDSLKAYDLQVTDTAFTSTYYGLELSYYYWRGDNRFSIYANIGGGYVTSNNTDTLSTISVTDKRSESSGVQSRETENKYQAFMGNYQESTYWKLYGNLYFFGSDNKWAFHLFPDVRFWDTAPIYNLGLGFVFSFKSKKDEKTIINAEPYIQFKDLGNHLQSINGKIVSNNSEKSIIGIRIGLPINPPSMKAQ